MLPGKMNLDDILKKKKKKEVHLVHFRLVYEFPMHAKPGCRSIWWGVQEKVR